MNSRISFAAILFLGLLASACSVSVGNGGDKDQSPNNPTAHRLDWKAIPSKFNPEIEDIQFSLAGGIDTIDVDAFGFDNDVEVVYPEKMSKDSGFLRVYKVWYKSASWGNLYPSTKDSVLKIDSSGSYQCSIKTENGAITQLEGGCYVRLQVVLPKGSRIEAYNLGRRISKRFKAVSTERLLAMIDDATWDKEKFAVIAEYLQSYKETSMKPQMTAEQLGTVIGEFMQSEDKFKVLRQLHRAVADRQSLGHMIESEFSYFDREKARKIVGL